MSSQMYDVEQQERIFVQRRDTRTIQPRPVHHPSQSASKYYLRGFLTTMPLLASDLFALVAALFVAAQVPRVWPTMGPLLDTLPTLLAFALPSTFFVFRLYPGIGLNAVAELRKATLATTLLFSTIIATAFAYGAALGTLAVFLTTYVGLLLLVPLCRSISRHLASRFSWWGQPILIFGDGETASRLFGHYSRHKSLGFRPIQAMGRHNTTYLEITDDDAEQLWYLRNKHQTFWAALANSLTEDSAKGIDAYVATFPHVLVVSGENRMPCTQHDRCDCAGLAGMLMTNRLMLPHCRLIKRLTDLFVGVCVGAAVLPAVIAITMLTKATSPGPVFYAQQRIGRNKKLFWAWKFRTMRIDADEVLATMLAADPELRDEWERDHKLRKDPRVTATGRFLRKSSLDELPQIWNILWGEMSLVGPRPIVAAEVEKYSDRFSYYTQATPGITGLWQISGRNNTTYDERVAFDTEYVLTWSPWLDLNILARTVKVVLRGEGAF